MLDAPESESPSGSERDAAEDPGMADAVRESLRSFGDLAEAVGHLLSAKIDQFKLSVRTLIIYAVLGVIGVFAGVTILVVAVVFLFIGAAHGLGAVLGGREWLGDLIVSLIVLGAALITLTFGLNKFKTASRRRTMRKYEDRRKGQQER